MSKYIGRFEIVRELGRGSQSVVFLARDPHLQREVAIKTLHFSRPDPKKNQQLLAEARIVSQLRHPSIVPIFEAGEEGGDVYLVFEYVTGGNLADALRDHGRLTPPKAIAIMLPVLEAMIHAHAAGIVHRDLKPSNILIDAQGLPRVMDFGIAARVEAHGQVGGEALSGTPAYMAPEYIARRESSERSDVFSAGLVFYELLTGARAVAGDDVEAVMRRIAEENVRLPAKLSGEFDETLVNLLYRALARDPQQRFATARDLRDALASYLQPEEAVVASDAKQSTVDFLLRRMRHKSDFPALSDSVNKINKITDSDKESISNLSTAILKDFSLTNKILRLANSVYFRQAGGGSISTISRAVLVLGFDAVRTISFTVMLFEHLQDKDNTGLLKDEFMRASLAGILAKEIAEKGATRDTEQVFICGMFHNLGRLLSQFYFPDESEEIKRLIEQKERSEDAATIQVLGISFEELGIGIARSWGFPNLIINSMRGLADGPVRKASTAEERVHVLASLANELCTMISDGDPTQRQKALRKTRLRYGDNLALDEQALLATMEKSFKEVAQFATILGINLKQSAFGRRIRDWSSTPDNLMGAEQIADGAATVLTDVVPPGAPGSLAADTEAESGVSHAEVILMAGIQDISNTLVEGFKINDVLRIILETMYRAKGFKRVVLCVREARGNTMLGRFGFGPDAPEAAKFFNFSLDAASDIFLAALSKGVDVLINDTRDAKVTSRLPEWYRRISAGTFVIFPLCIKGRPVAMIYADSDRAGDIVISEKELSLLRTLRNQAVLAIKQSS